MSDSRTGVLLMAYGSPETPDEVEPYFTHIRGGRVPSAESVERLKERYQVVGGRTPLLDITMSLRSRLERALNAQPAHSPTRVYAGMKHWHPFIGDVLPQIADDGVRTLVAVPLAPHYSRISIGGYRKAVDDAVGKLGRPMKVHFVESWHLHDQYIELAARRVRETLDSWPAATPVITLFSAHSLPVRIREWNDPYERQLLESCEAIAARAGIARWHFAWQSAGHTGEPWLGPDICEALVTLRNAGVRDVISAPIGFVCDHLEILYDIDHEARAKADQLGMTLRRIRMPNADPTFIGVLESVVSEQLAPPTA